MTYIPYINPLLTNRNLDFQRQYAKNELYYGGIGVYDDASMAAYGLSKWTEALKPLRNVCHRSVEFYATKMLTGNVQIVTGEEGDAHPLLDAINQVLTWSNFNEKKQLYTRDLSKLGDLWWKVMVEEDKVYLQQVPAENVVEFDEDVRGYLSHVRIETPITSDKPGVNMWRTEYYAKDEDIPYYSVWEGNLQYPTPLEEYGTPLEWGPLASFGISFVNFVHVKFQDTGALRGVGCFAHALDKQDEANRQATRLAQMVFKKAGGTTWLKQNAFDKDNRPLPAAPIRDATGKVTNALELTDDLLPRLPAGTTLESTVPAIAWAAIRDIANDQVEELREDMPELRYYASIEGANLSGKSRSIMLAPALDRAREAGTNFATGLSRALKMALTMGQFAGILQPPGTYDAGNFEHSITIPDVFAPDAAEKAQTLQALKSAGIELGLAMEMSGFSKDEVEKATAAAEEAQRAKAELAINMVNKIGEQNDAARKEAADKKIVEKKE
jgi:hypothetical protein